jgi:2-polyprenyl-3-methyl-5-hydroxy-6-metoxy-1,4-benzoquinol methylase
VSALDQRLYLNYASTHAGLGNDSTAAVYRRDIRPHLPSDPRCRRILDIGAGRGDLVRQLENDGFDAHGVDISPEQVKLAHAAGVHSVELGDFHSLLATADGHWDAVVATDVLEHLDKDSVMRTFDDVNRALRAGGVFVARVPNAVSPTGGHLMYGDITHQTWFTQRSIRQVAAVAGFQCVETFACPPVVHGIRSAVRAAIWKPVSGLLKTALAAETGQLRGHIVTHNLTFVAHQAESTPRTRP